jgi:hypothetical protein
MAWWTSDIFLSFGIPTCASAKQSDRSSIPCFFGRLENAGGFAALPEKEMLLQGSREAYWLATVGIN